MPKMPKSPKYYIIIFISIIYLFVDVYSFIIYLKLDSFFNSVSAYYKGLRFTCVYYNSFWPW